MAAVRIAFVVGTLALGLWLFAQMDHAGASMFFLTYGGIGGYLIIRRPANPIGWLLLLIGFGLELGTVRVVVPASGALVPSDLVTAIGIWGSGCGWSLAFLGILCLSLTFPEGRLPSGWGGRLSKLAIVAMVVLVLAVALNPVVNVIPVNDSFDFLAPNPAAIAPDAFFWSLVPATDALYNSMLVIVVLGIVAVLVRARRATGLVRLQYRWLIAALVLIVISTVAWAVATFAQGMDAFGVAFIPVLLGYAAVPAAIAIAVLRYRLYEIDRIISRTLSWAIVTGVLLVVFAGLVVGLQALLERGDPGADPGGCRLHAGCIRPVPARPPECAARRRPTLRPRPLRQRAHGGRICRAAADRGRPRSRRRRPDRLGRTRITPPHARALAQGSVR